MSTPRKGDIIINPKTNRPIKVGGRSWLKLVKEGVIEGRYTDPKELAPIQEDGNIDEQIRRANENLPRGVQAVRGRGRYKGKIVSRKQQPKTEEVARHTARLASRKVSENLDSLNEYETNEDLEAELERMILEEMALTNEPQTPKPKRGRGRPRKTPKQERYITEEPPLYDEEEEYIDTTDRQYYDVDDGDDGDDEDPFSDIEEY